jgi:hypothetical protein
MPMGVLLPDILGMFPSGMLYLAASGCDEQKRSSYQQNAIKKGTAKLTVSYPVRAAVFIAPPVPHASFADASTATIEETATGEQQ